MDSRISIDEAKKLRLDTSNTRPSSRNGEAPEQEAPGWKEPVYIECRSVRLDPETLRKNRCVCFFPEAPELSSYKVLRTQIVHRCRPNHWNTIMITSAVPGEGKTLTAINLAAAFARAHGQTALLVDCDLQRQSVHQYLGVQSPQGLADYLQNGGSLKDFIIWPGVENLTFISGGKPIRDSSELVSSPKMAELAAEMKARYPDRYIFFDLPPLLAEADALAFAPLVDCILMVVHPGTSFKDIQRSLELVPKEKFLGFVLNRVESSNDDYYYRYKYAYRYKKEG
jgi:protein-tyrosine kinase